MVGVTITVSLSVEEDNEGYIKIDTKTHPTCKGGKTPPPFFFSNKLRKFFLCIDEDTTFIQVPSIESKYLLSF